MTDRIGTRKDGQHFSATTAPDVCLTPMGSSKVPVPYSSIGFFSDTVKGVASVRLNGKVGVSIASAISKSQGTEAGTGKGIKSGKNVGPVRIPKASGSVNFGGSQAVRHADKTDMNCSSTG